mmetsp:Transcript_17021/g.39084  ORF Transcript_17021/g.39084 Transcript_17021/m.39084 type:complete len:262 (-) Transcript_17021:437-1222(-)
MPTVAVGTVLVAGKVANGELSGRGPGDFHFDAQGVVPGENAEVSHFSPVLSPGISDNPIDIARFVVGFPPNDAHNVVHQHVPDLGVVYATAGVLDDGFRVDSGGNGTPGVDLALDLVDDAGGICQVAVGSVFGDRCVRHHIDFCALATHSTKGITGLAGIGFRTRSIDVRTKAFGRLRTAGKVWLARVVGDHAAVLNEFVNTRVASAVAAAGGVRGAIENVLDAEVDLVSRSVAGNLDAVSQRREGTVCPATTAILGNVLV